MVSLIYDDSIAEVRERARIEEVISEYVPLRRSGAGTYKGLCPFHDEKTPSFQVNETKGLYHCFGCGESGDVITFVKKMENLEFSEAMEYLASKFGVRLRYSGNHKPGVPSDLRRLIRTINQAAMEFYSAQIDSPEAQVFRDFAQGRGFDRDICLHFNMGYAPAGGYALHTVLARHGFTDQQMVAAGLVYPGGKDRFQGRAIWPIIDVGSSVLGFGARRIRPDDSHPAKYVNSPETPIYKKSQVLYGLNLARPEIGRQAQAVIVEGYTDVMACHLAGVTTAVASCGTAFGSDHAKMIRKYIGAVEEGQGEIIFTFDSDQAGQKAASKAFELIDVFSGLNTSVASDPQGEDPCDIRLSRGAKALASMIDNRVPMHEFMIDRTLSQFDLGRSDSRVDAIRAVARLLASVRDRDKRQGYINDLSLRVGMDLRQVQQIASSTRPANSGTARREHVVEVQALDTPATKTRLDVPDPDDRHLRVERDTLHLIVQYPTLFDSSWNGLVVDDFTHPVYREIFALIRDHPFTPDRWHNQILDAAGDPSVYQVLSELLVDSAVRAQPTINYASLHTLKLRELALRRHLDDARSRLRRTQSVDDQMTVTQLQQHLQAVQQAAAALNS